MKKIKMTLELELALLQIKIKVLGQLAKLAWGLRIGW